MSEHAGVDAALERLQELDALPLHEHVTVYESIHAALQDHLAAGGD